MNGFTLIELILVMAIASIVLVVVSQVFFFSIKTHSKQHALVSIEMDTRTFFHVLSADIRRSERVEIDGNALIVTREGISKRYEKQGKHIMRNSNVLIHNASDFSFSISEEVLSVSAQSAYGEETFALSVVLSLLGKEVVQ